MLFFACSFAPSNYFSCTKIEKAMGHGKSLNSLLILFCRGKVMSAMSNCRQSCTRAVHLAGLIPLAGWAICWQPRPCSCLAAMLLSLPKGGAGIHNLLMNIHGPVQGGDRFIVHGYASAWRSAVGRPLELLGVLLASTLLGSVKTNKGDPEFWITLPDICICVPLLLHQIPMISCILVDENTELALEWDLEFKPVGRNCSRGLNPIFFPPRYCFPPPLSLEGLPQMLHTDAARNLT